MATAFNLFPIDKFPKASTIGQVVFERGNAELRGTDKRTKVTFCESDAFDRFDRFQVLHETVRRAQGRIYEGDEFDRFFERNEFDMFVDRKAKVLYCNASKATSRNLIDVLNESSSRFRFDYFEMDFDQVKPRLNEISGIWVSNIQAANLNVMALFGKHVDQSEFFKQAQAIGIASALLIAYGWGSEIYPVILSRAGGIAFPMALPQAQCIDLLESVQTNLLDGALRRVDSKRTAREKREEAKEREKATKASAATTKRR